MLATAQPPGWAVPAALSAFGVGGTLGSIRAARLTIRHVPQLNIRHDDSIEAGDRVLRILKELEEERGDDA